MSSMPDGTQPEPRRAESALTRQVDPATGIILVEGSGMWSGDASAAHFAEMQVLVASARRQSGPVRVLVDLASAQVQTSTVSRSIQEQAETLYNEGDKIGIVVTSPLLAMQMRGVGGRASYRHFASRADAFTWLKSD